MVWPHVSQSYVFGKDQRLKRERRGGNGRQAGAGAYFSFLLSGKERLRGCGIQSYIRACPVYFQPGLYEYVLDSVLLPGGLILPALSRTLPHAGFSDSSGGQ